MIMWNYGANFDNMYQILQLEEDLENNMVPIQYDLDNDTIQRNEYVYMSYNIRFEKIDGTWYCYYYDVQDSPIC